MDTKIDIPSSPSSSPPPSPSPFRKLTYDVYVSFRGKDTRTNFTDHLHTALTQKGINTFREEEELKRGESIGPNLFKAIEESRFVIVVFSQNYANSSWCLDELAKVAECRRAMGQIVLPVFYDVDPYEVRRQTGEHFGKAFEKHQERFGGNPDKLQRWKDALAEVGNLSGWHLKDGYQSKVIQEIVAKVFIELNQIISISEGLVGMDSHLNEVLSYLDIGCPDVRIIGICGMGGIGKTTIAQVVFEMVQAQFEGCCFLENVRQVTEQQGAVHLQEQLLLNLLNCSVNVQNTRMGRTIMRQRLRTKRVLLIVDDVDQEEQLEALCDRESFGPGSRIIITSRDEHLLSAVEGDKVYNVNPLTDAEALELFRMKAFKKGQLVGEDFLELSKEFLKYADGLPLAIKVLGSSVRGRNVKLWSSELDRLKIKARHKTKATSAAEWRFLLAGLCLEIFSLAFDQASSPTKPQYALFGILSAFAALVLSLWELNLLIHQYRKERAKSKTGGVPRFHDHPRSFYAVLASTSIIYGLAFGITQCVFSTVQYVFFLRHGNNPIKASLLPAVFLICLAIKRLIQPTYAGE